MILHENELKVLASTIKGKYTKEEIDFLVSLLKPVVRIDERKDNPYGTYASAAKCPYCGK